MDPFQNGDLRDKYNKAREKLISEFQIVKDISMELTGFKVSMLVKDVLLIILPRFVQELPGYP